MATESGAITDSGSGATDTGADASTDTGTDEGAGAVDADGDPIVSDTGAAKTPEVKKRNIKWFGRDEELTDDELAARFTDEFEVPFHGLGGKPLLRDGKPLTRKWTDIVRDVQMAHGAADAARRSNETKKQYEDRIAWGKQPENRMAFLQRELGVEDADGWILTQASEAYKKRQRLVELSQKDPVAYEREMRTDFEQRQKQMQESTARLEQQRSQAQQNEERKAQFFGKVESELKPFKVPLNARTREMVDSIMNDYVAAGAEISFADLASHVRDQYRAEMFSHLDGHTDEELLKLFGDKRRERLRKAEITALKGAKKAAAPAPKTSPTTRSAPKGETPEEYMRRTRAR